MKEDLLESLAQLEQDLKKIDSARTMVEKTVDAYQGVSVGIKAYSDALADTSKNIRELIADLKANKDSISDQISTELQAILDKFDKSVVSFKHTADGLQAVFETQSKNLITGLSDDLSKSTNNMVDSTNRIQKSFEKSTDNIANSFTHNTEDSITKLNQTVKHFDESAAAFSAEMDKRFKALQEENKLIQKQQKLQTILSIIISIICLATLVLRFV